MKNYNRESYKAPMFHSSLDFYRLKLSKSKLKAVTRTSALLSGFAMVAMVELGLDYSSLADETLADEIGNDPDINLNSLSNLTNTTPQIIKKILKKNKFVIPQSILVLYALVTCLLVGVHMLALMISTCILPQIEALSFEENEMEHQNRQEQSYLNQTHNFNTAEAKTQLVNENNTNYNDRLLSLNRRILDNNQQSKYQNTAYDSTHYDSKLQFPYIQYHRFIELAWISSTVVGIFLFLVEIGLVCYIKFYPISYLAALTGAIVMTPILIIFVVFTFTFYKRLAVFKVDLTKKALSQVDRSLIPNVNVI